MIISRSVFNKISKVVFSTTEPSSTLVLWGKPSDPYYDFYIYEAGTWQYVAGVQEESGEVVPLPNIPSKLSEYTNDVGFITEVDLADYLEEHGFTPGGGGGASSWDDIEDKPDFATVATSGSYEDLTDTPGIWSSSLPIPANPVAEEINSIVTVGSVSQNLAGKEDALYYIPPIYYEESVDGKTPVLVTTDTSSFQTIVDVVTASGGGWDTVQYKDLAIPTVAAIEEKIPAAVTESTVSGWGFTKNTGTYSKPSTGIPATDLASAVQTSLGKADTALQTQVQVDWNQTTTTAADFIKNKPTIPAAQIQSDWNQTTTTAKDYIKNKPTIPTVPTNVSAFNNDAGYLTSHQDISSKADKVVVVDASTLPSTLDPNKVYQMGTLTGSVTIPAFSAVASGDTEAKIWCFTFNTSTTAPTITWPAAITNWVGGSAPTINASKSYEVTVMDGIGAIMEA